MEVHRIRNAIEDEQLAKHRALERAKNRRGLDVIYRSVDDAMRATGTSSPRAALMALKASGKLPTRGTYMPHFGAKQREKVRKVLARGVVLCAG